MSALFGGSSCPCSGPGPRERPHTPACTAVLLCMCTRVGTVFMYTCGPQAHHASAPWQVIKPRQNKPHLRVCSPLPAPGRLPLNQCSVCCSIAHLVDVEKALDVGYSLKQSMGKGRAHLFKVQGCPGAVPCRPAGSLPGRQSEGVTGVRTPVAGSA